LAQDAGFGRPDPEIPHAVLLSERVLKMLEFRLEAVASGRISVVCRLKPELQRAVIRFQDTLSELRSPRAPLPSQSG
jgi:hypothetical protein